VSVINKKGKLPHSASACGHEQDLECCILLIAFKDPFPLTQRVRAIYSNEGNFARRQEDPDKVE